MGIDQKPETPSIIEETKTYERKIFIAKLVSIASICLSLCGSGLLVYLKLAPCKDYSDLSQAQKLGCDNTAYLGMVLSGSGMITTIGANILGSSWEESLREARNYEKRNKGFPETL